MIKNGYNESFNSKLRDEILNTEIFFTLKEAKVLIERWRHHYNAGIAQEALHEAPHVRGLNRVRDIAAEIHTIFAKCSPRS